MARPSSLHRARAKYARAHLVKAAQIGRKLDAALRIEQSQVTEMSASSLRICLEQITDIESHVLRMRDYLLDCSTEESRKAKTLNGEES